MQARSLAVIAAVALLATLIAPVNVAASGPGIVLSTTSISIQEPAADGATTTATYRVRLNTMPQGTIQVNLAVPGPDVTVAPASLQFTPADWDQNKDVTVTVKGDNLVEGFEQHTISHTIAAGAASDPAYKDVTASLAVKVADNDVGILVSESGGSTAVLERTGSGRTDSFTVALGTSPAAGSTVTIAFTYPSQIFLSTNSVVFTTSTWKTPKTVTVSAETNDVDQDDRSVDITYAVTAAAADPYNGRSGSLDVTIVEDDVAGFNLGPTGSVNVLPNPVLEVKEAEAGDATRKVEYPVKLTSKPLANVVLSLTANPQVSVAPASITFGPDNWSTAVMVTVRALDDQVDEASANSGAITQASSSSDPNYATIPAGVASVPINVVDNDAAALTVVPAPNLGISVLEGDEDGDTFTVALNSRPTAAVTVALTPSVTGQVALSATTLTFAAGTNPADSAQEVTVTALDNEDPELTKTLQVTLNPSSADTFYNGLADVPVAVQVLDDDGVALFDLGDGLVVTEGGDGDTYTISLVEQPSEPTVTVNLAANGGFSVSPSQIVFHREQAPLPADQTCFLGPHELPEVGTGPVLDLVEQVADAIPTVGELQDMIEDLEASMSNHSEPLCLPCPEPVDIDTPVNTCTPDGGTGVDVLLWNEAATVTVTATNDDAVEAYDATGTVKHAVVGSGNYAGAEITDVPVAVASDEPAVLLAHTGAGTTVGEDGATDTYTVVLASPPDFVVQVAFDGGDSLGAMPTLAFDENDWNQPRTVTVSALQDSIDQGTSHAAAIEHTVSTAIEGAYYELEVDDLAVTITDDDVSSLQFGQSGDSTAVVEGGATDSYSVRLTSIPTADVIVTPTTDGQVTLNKASLTFTPANWNVFQSIQVTAVNDDSIEGAHQAIVSHAMASGDGHYDGSAAPDLAVSITDNDAAGLQFGQSGGNTAVVEGGATDSYSVRLTSIPTADVIVTPTTDGQVTLNKASLTFTPANWNVFQSIQVTAVNDAAVEGAHAGTVAHALESADPFYDGVAVGSIVVAITDND